MSYSVVNARVINWTNENLNKIHLMDLWPPKTTLHYDF